MRGLNNPFPAPGTEDVHRRFSLGPPLLLPEEAPWKKTIYTNFGFPALKSRVHRLAPDSLKIISLKPGANVVDNLYLSEQLDLLLRQLTIFAVARFQLVEPEPCDWSDATKQLVGRAKLKWDWNNLLNPDRCWYLLAPIPSFSLWTLCLWKVGSSLFLRLTSISRKSAKLRLTRSVSSWLL